MPKYGNNSLADEQVRLVTTIPPNSNDHLIGSAGGSHKSLTLGLFTAHPQLANKHRQVLTAMYGLWGQPIILGSRPF